MKLKAVISLTEESALTDVYRALRNLSAINVNAIVVTNLHTPIKSPYLQVITADFMRHFNAGFKALPSDTTHVLFLKAGEAPDPIPLLRFINNHEYSHIKAALFPAGTNTRTGQQNASERPLIARYDYLQGLLIGGYTDRAALFWNGTSTYISRTLKRITGGFIMPGAAITC